MNSIRTLILAALALVAASASAQTTVVSSLPLVISTSGKYQLSKHLKDTSGAYLVTINASDVELDLNGFSIQGGNNSIGIWMKDSMNVRVTNGRIAYVLSGLLTIGNCSGLTVDHVKFTNCINSGIAMDTAVPAPGTVISNNSFYDLGNGTRSLWEVITVAGGTRVENNTIGPISTLPKAVTTGIKATISDFIIGNTISSKTYGVNGGKCLNNLTLNCSTPFINTVNATGNN